MITPQFQQSLGDGVYKRISNNIDKNYQIIYQDIISGDELSVPNIWYNQSVQENIISNLWHMKHGKNITEQMIVYHDRKAGMLGLMASGSEEDKILSEHFFSGMYKMGLYHDEKNDTYRQFKRQDHLAYLDLGHHVFGEKLLAIQDQLDQLGLGIQYTRTIGQVTETRSAKLTVYDVIEFYRDIPNSVVIEFEEGALMKDVLKRHIEKFNMYEKSQYGRGFTAEALPFQNKQSLKI